MPESPPPPPAYSLPDDQSPSRDGNEQRSPLLSHLQNGGNTSRGQTQPSLAYNRRAPEGSQDKKKNGPKFIHKRTSSLNRAPISGGTVSSAPRPQAFRHEERQGLLFDGRNDDLFLTVDTSLNGQEESLSSSEDEYGVGHRISGSDDEHNRRLSESSRAGSTESLRREIEQFDEIQDPSTIRRAGRRYKFKSRTARAFCGFWHLMNSKLIRPVRSRYDAMSQKMDKILSRVGNPLVIRRFLYVGIVAAFMYLIFSSGMIPFTYNAGDDLPLNPTYYDQEFLRDRVSEIIDKAHLRDQLQFISSVPHIAGTKADLALANHVFKVMDDYRIPYRDKMELEVYMNYPVKEKQSLKLYGLGKDTDSEPIFDANLEEADASPQDKKQEQPLAFHGYSKTGKATGPLVYANYGRKIDFKRLKDTGVITEGAVVIVRDGGNIDLSMKILAAQMSGAVGLISFSDKSKVEPSLPLGRDYPLGSIQRGTAAISGYYMGDPISPASTSMNRESDTCSDDFLACPKIPSMPISWEVARNLLESLKGIGNRVQGEWVGAEPELSEWWTGNGQSKKKHKRKDDSSPIVELENGTREFGSHPVWNVLGEFPGVEQAEKALVIGAHRDSWCDGASDSASGTAILLELMRVFSVLYHDLGWRPLRSIYFGSFDGAQYSSVGVVEWMEGSENKLGENGFTYINLDDAISGDELSIEAHPGHFGLIRMLLDLVDYPITNTSLREAFENVEFKLPPRSGDSVAFMSRVGIPTIDIGFSSKDGVEPRHSCFDNFAWMSEWGDPTFDRHVALTHILSLIILKLCYDVIIPFDFGSYAESLAKSARDLDSYSQSKNGPALDFGMLQAGINRLGNNMHILDEWRQFWQDSVNQNAGSEVRNLAAHRWNWNNKITNFDKHMLLDNGLSVDRNWYKHCTFGPSLWVPEGEGNYESNTYPSIRDAIEESNWEAAVSALNKVSNRIYKAADKFAS